jgi:chemotaxis protein MotB
MKIFKILAVSAMVLGMTSCVSKKQYDALSSNYKQCIENIGERQREIQDLKSQNSALASENNLLKSQHDALKSSLMRVFPIQGKVLLILTSW